MARAAETVEERPEGLVYRPGVIAVEEERQLKPLSRSVTER